MAEEYDYSDLNSRQRAFVSEYLRDLNATQAAIRAGYSPTSAAETASLFLSNPKFSACIERAKAERLSRVNLKADDVLHEMSLLAMSRIDHYEVTADGNVVLAPGAPEGAMAAVQSIKKKTRIFKDRLGVETHREYDVEIRLWDKPTPLKLTGRHAGLYPDRMEITGKGGAPIVAKIIREIVDPVNHAVDPVDHE